MTASRRTATLLLPSMTSLPSTGDTCEQPTRSNRPFATIRLRHRKTKGNGTRRASLAMMFKLAQSASKKWRRLRSHEKITFVIEGRSFKDGIMQEVAA